MTATIIASPDLGTVHLPDDAELIPCESPKHESPVAARWAVCCLGCSEVTLACTKCKEWYDERQLARSAVRCSICNSWYPTPFPWVRI